MLGCVHSPVGLMWGMRMEKLMERGWTGGQWLYCGWLQMCSQGILSIHACIQEKLSAHRVQTLTWAGEPTVNLGMGKVETGATKQGWAQGECFWGL